MSAFTSPLEIRPVGCGRWELLKAFSFYTELTEPPETIYVPKAFTTDFASIPRALWWLYPPYGDTWGKAAVIHDWLYATQPKWCDRHMADDVFLEGMKILGANWLRRTIMHQSVRLFAGKAWQNHAERIASGKTVEEWLAEKQI